MGPWGRGGGGSGCLSLPSSVPSRQGLTFVSVHDCYWTHALTVDIMNKVRRTLTQPQAELACVAVGFEGLTLLAWQELQGLSLGASCRRWTATAVCCNPLSFLVVDVPGQGENPCRWPGWAENSRSAPGNSGQDVPLGAPAWKPLEICCDTLWDLLVLSGLQPAPPPPSP